MAFDYQGLSCVTLYLITIHISNINSRTSTHWRLCDETGQVRPADFGSQIPNLPGTVASDAIPVASDDELIDMEDKLMTILIGPPEKHWRDDFWILDTGERKATREAIPIATSDPPAAGSANSGHSSSIPTYTVAATSVTSPTLVEEKINSNEGSAGDEEASPMSNSTTLSADNGPRKARKLPITKEPQQRIRPRPSSVETDRTVTIIGGVNILTNQSGRRNGTSGLYSNGDSSMTKNSTGNHSSAAHQALPKLECRPYPNHTQYDHLRGLIARHTLPPHPEPEVAAVFRRRMGPGRVEVNLDQLEARLAESKSRRPNSPQVYNQIGNFLRIHGDSSGAVECFRRSLALAPSHPDVLLNLARVLFNQHYLDDAIYLTRRSLETQAPDRNSWLQHFTLGEILKSSGHLQEAEFHFRHALELKPGFEPAQAHLRELEQYQSPAVTYYTLFIILFLVMMVLAGLLTSIEYSLDACTEGLKPPRHFNRGLAIRTLKLGISPRLRMRRLGAPATSSTPTNSNPTPGSPSNQGSANTAANTPSSNG